MARWQVHLLISPGDGQESVLDLHITADHWLTSWVLKSAVDQLNDYCEAVDNDEKEDPDARPRTD